MRALGSCAVVVAVACHSGAKPPAPTATDARAAPPVAAAIAAVAAPPADAGPVDAELDARGLDAPAPVSCDRVVDAFWRGAQPGLRKLGLAITKSLEHDYKAAYALGHFSDDCRLLSNDTRACLVRAPNALTAIGDCGADPFYFRPTSIAELSHLVSYTALSADEQRRALARLVGTWADPSFGSLVITADGRVRTSFEHYGLHSFHMKLDYQWLVEFDNGAQFIDVFSYALEDHDTLSFCVNSLYNHRPRVGGEDVFVTRFDDDTVFYDHGRCTVVTQLGELVPASCPIETDPRGERVLRLSYARAYWPITDAKFLLLPGQLVDLACPVLHRAAR